MKLVQEGNRSFDLVQRRVYRLAPILIPAEYESAEYVTFFGFNGCVGGSVQPLITNEGSVFDFFFVSRFYLHGRPPRQDPCRLRFAPTNPTVYCSTTMVLHMRR